MNTQTETVETFKANLQKAIRDKECVSIGGGEFNYVELSLVLAALNDLSRYEEHGLTCQTYGKGVVVPCGECNLGYKE